MSNDLYHDDVAEYQQQERDRDDAIAKMIEDPNCDLMQWLNLEIPTDAIVCLLRQLGQSTAKATRMTADRIKAVELIEEALSKELDFVVEHKRAMNDTVRPGTPIDADPHWPEAA